MSARRFFAPSFRTALLGCAVVLATGLGACSMQTDTDMPQYKKVRLERGPAEQAMPVAALDAAALEAFAKEYNSLGDGPVELTVTYDPRSRTNTAMNATEHAARIARELRYHGVTDVRTSILPVNAQGDGAEALMRYEAVTAHAPEGCDYMGGLDGKDTMPQDDYVYGCTTQMLLARQVARPKDLAGRDDLAPRDARRAVGSVETYRSGADLPAIDVTTTQ
jgi:pilus biogenesis lipoprotein CpaD